jgi:ABC-type lipoprotein release transport system permease subunit
MMPAIWTWAWLDLRRRWASQLVLVLLVALTVGTGAAALAGARRGASAPDRLQSESRGMNALIPANPGIQYRWSDFDALPYVEARAGIAQVAGVRFDGADNTDWLTTATDDAMFSKVDKAVVLEGRAYDPRRANELMITKDFAEHHHVSVGDSIKVQLPTLAQAKGAFEEEQEVENPQGPRVTWTIVGIVMTPWLTPETAIPNGKAALSPATLTTYADNLLGGHTADEATLISVFRLHDLDTDIARLTNDARRLTGRTDVDVWNYNERFMQPARDSARFEAITLAAFGLAALLAGAFLIGSTIARSAASEAIELRKGRAIGMTPAQISGAAALTTALAATLGAVIGAIAALIASAHFPLGSARLLEPNPGIALDGAVLPVVAVVAAAFATAVALLAARRQVSAATSSTASPVSTIASRLSELSAPVPVVIGTRLALETSPGRSAVPVRPAQLGAVLAVTGTIAVLVFSAGIHDALTHPERFGQVQQLEAFTGYEGQEFIDAEATVAKLRSLDYVTGVWSARQGNATADNGKVSLIVYSGADGEKALAPVVAQGHLPDSASGIFLGRRTARALDVGVGDTLKITGSAATRSVRVTGVGFLPPGAHNGYADGGWVTGAAYPTLFSDFHFHTILVAAAGLTTDQLGTRLAAAFPPDKTGLSFGEPQKVQAVTQLRSVRRFPIALAVFLAILGIGVVGGALIVAVRRRVGELAILRTLGMTGVQASATVCTQAIVLTLVGLAFGIPLGMALGRLAWRAVATFVPLDFVAPGWGSPLLLVSACAILLALALAVAPARRAARFSIATALRAE